MQDLISIRSSALSGAAIPTVNARDLHACLGAGRDFSNWIKGRIARYGFQEGVDYTTVDNSSAIDSPNRANQTGRGGDRRSIDYHLSLDMAKELAMLENNPKGREIRRYFIDAERRLREAPEATRAALLAARPQWDTILRCDAAGLTNREIGRVLGCHEKTVRSHKSKMWACGLPVGGAK